METPDEQSQCYIYNKRYIRSNYLKGRLVQIFFWEKLQNLCWCIMVFV